LVDAIDKLLLESSINMMVQLPEVEVFLVVSEERLDLGHCGSARDDRDDAGIDGLNEDDGRESGVNGWRHR
jgi:hypothetical protein